MRVGSKLLPASLISSLALPLCAQDLAPGAYVITPVSSNAATFTYSFYDGGVNFNGAVPVTNATGPFSVPVFSFTIRSVSSAVPPTYSQCCHTGLGTFKAS